MKKNVVLKACVIHRIFINDLPKLNALGITFSTTGRLPSFITMQVASSEFSLFKLMAMYL